MMEKLEALDVETLTPIEALNFLYELKKDPERQPEWLILFETEGNEWQRYTFSTSTRQNLSPPVR